MPPTMGFKRRHPTGTAAAYVRVSSRAQSYATQRARTGRAYDPIPGPTMLGESFKAVDDSIRGGRNLDLIVSAPVT